MKRFPWVEHRTLLEVHETDRLRAALAEYGGVMLPDERNKLGRRLIVLEGKERAFNPSVGNPGRPAA